MSALRISHPGVPTRIVDLDPYAVLTERQQRVLEVVRAYNGNRCRAARQLGVDVRTVQQHLRCIARAGVPVPRIARRGPDPRPRTRGVRSADV